MRARWVPLGRIAPGAFYASAQAVGECTGPDDAPAVLWGCCDRPHLCIGAGQDAAAELDLAACRAAGLAVHRRPLGGGAVWVDPWQWCFIFVVPRRAAPAVRARFLERCLGTAALTCAGFGIAAAPAGGSDLWVKGRKILGSGAASLGAAYLWGASFLLRFDAAAFATAVRAPNPGFRAWLRRELEDGMTDWAREGVRPAAEALEARFRRAVAEGMGWELAASALTPAEAAALPAARAELEEPETAGGRRRISGGVKIRDRVFLVERGGCPGTLRLVLRDGRIVRLGWWPDGDSGGGGVVEIRGAWSLRADGLQGALARSRARACAARIAAAAVALARETLEEAGDEPADD